MNRDEYRNRVESNAIHNQNSCFYPIDKQSGGTWFGFNQHGTVMALLNRYQDRSIPTNTSRGTIIPTLLESTAIENDLHNMINKDFNPFDLITVTGKHIQQYSWDRKQLIKHKKNSPFFHTSSSIDSSNTIKYRHKIFNTHKAKDEKDILSNLHLLQTKTDESRSIYMSRDVTHTKSISQIISSKESFTYHYFTEQSLININKESPYQSSQKLMCVL